MVTGIRLRSLKPLSVNRKIIFFYNIAISAKGWSFCTQKPFQNVWSWKCIFRALLEWGGSESTSLRGVLHDANNIYGSRNGSFLFCRNYAAHDTNFTDDMRIIYDLNIPFYNVVTTKIARARNKVKCWSTHRSNISKKSVSHTRDYLVRV